MESDDDGEIEMEPAPNSRGFSMFSALDVDKSGSDKGSDSEPEVNNKAAQQKRGKNKKKGGVPSSDQPHTNNVDEKLKEATVTEKPPTKTQGKKAKNKAGDDDFDAILAEFCAPNNASGTAAAPAPANEKKDRKKKKGGKNTDDIDQVPSSAIEPVVPTSEANEQKGIENRIMTQEEVAKFMEDMYPDSDDDKKKAKKNKKKQKQEKADKEGADGAEENEAVPSKGKQNKKMKAGNDVTKDKAQQQAKAVNQEEAVNDTDIASTLKTEKQEPAKQDKKKPVCFAREFCRFFNRVLDSLQYYYYYFF